MPGKPTLVPTKVEVKISEPPPRATIAGTWYLAPRKALVRMASMVSRQPDVESSAAGAITPSVPALLTAMSSPPKRSTAVRRSEEHTSELQSLMRISYAAFGLKKNKDDHLAQ